MKNKTRGLALAMSLCMALMPSMSVFAEELPNPSGTDEVIASETTEAETVSETESVLQEDTEASLDDETSTTEETVIEETVIEETVIEEETELESETEEVEPEVEIPQIMYGTVSDTLASQGDYKIYPVPCLQGMYMQANLFIDVNANIDYDLYLIDENYNIITGCDYDTNNTVGNKYLSENIGYINEGPDCYYYLFVFASYFGETEPKEFTLDYGLTSVIGDNEPAEHALSAQMVNLVPGSNTINGVLNSALDNDWYVFMMPQGTDGKDLSGIHIERTSESENNGIRTELYSMGTSENDRSVMMRVSTADSIGIRPGNIYFLRVYSDKDIYHYDLNSAPNYTVNISTVLKPTACRLSSVNGPKEKFYDNTLIFRVERSENSVNIAGDVNMGHGNTIGMGVNDCELIVRYISEDGSFVERHTTTYNSGNFLTGMYIPPAQGRHHTSAIVSEHYFDICFVQVVLASTGEELAREPVIQLSRSDPYIQH